MGRFNYSQYFRLNSGVYARIHSLLNQAQNTFRGIKGSEDPQKIEKLKAILSAGLLFVLSLVLGVWAYEVTQREGLFRWERDHIPSTYVVQKSFQSLGYTHVSDLKVITRLFRTLSLSTDEKGGFWASSDQNWIAYYGEDPKNSEELSFQFYCEICQASLSTLNWQPLERGWRGFEEVLRVLEKKKPRVLVSTPESKKVKKTRKATYRDPREIIY